MLKNDGVLGADPPTLTAPCALNHVVGKGPFISHILKLQGGCRTILDAGQTTVAVIVYSEIRHISI